MLFVGRALTARQAPVKGRPSTNSSEEIMVLTKSELVTSFQNEVRILLHLASKIDRAWLDYRPTPKQRSTMELLKYLSYMGPMLVKLALGSFDRGDRSVWTAVQQAADKRNFDETLAEIASHREAYATLLADVPDADLRVEMDGFGGKTTRGRLRTRNFSVSETMHPSVEIGDLPRGARYCVSRVRMRPTSTRVSFRA